MDIVKKGLAFFLVTVIFKSHLSIQPFKWKSTEEQASFMLSSAALRFFSKKGYGNELAKKGKLFPSY